MNVLHIDSSIQGEASVSRTLTQEVVDALHTAQPDAAITYRDLAQDIHGHVGGRNPDGFATPDDAQGLNETLLDEFLGADVIVLGAPMYNFSIPTHLKSWFDRIAVPGKTFRYGPAGVEGLAKGKKAVVVSTAGGVHTGSPTSVGHEDYLKLILGFMGITDVDFVRAQGVAMGPDAKNAALAGARTKIHELVAA